MLPSLSQAVSLAVSDVVVLIDREQGGASRLAADKLNLHAAFPLSFILEVRPAAGGGSTVDTIPELPAWVVVYTALVSRSCKQQISLRGSAVCTAADRVVHTKKVLVRRSLVTKELAATVTKFISENQTHRPGQPAPASAAAPSPAQPAKRWGQDPCDWPTVLLAAVVDAAPDCAMGSCVRSCGHLLVMTQSTLTPATGCRMRSGRSWRSASWGSSSSGSWRGSRATWRLQLTCPRARRCWRLQTRWAAVRSVYQG